VNKERKFIEIDKKQRVEHPELGEGAREMTLSEVFMHFLQGIAQSLC
jgi:hypothetical protein